MNIEFALKNLTTATPNRIYYVSHINASNFKSNVKIAKKRGYNVYIAGKSGFTFDCLPGIVKNFKKGDTVIIEGAFFKPYTKHLTSFAVRGGRYLHSFNGQCSGNLKVSASVIPEKPFTLSLINAISLVFATSLITIVLHHWM